MTIKFFLVSKTIFLFIINFFITLLLWLFNFLKLLILPLAKIARKTKFNRENLEEVIIANSTSRLKKYFQENKNLKISISYFRGDNHYYNIDLDELLKKEKIIKSSISSKLESMICQLFNLNISIKGIKCLQETKYDKNDNSHEEKLKQLWNNMMPQKEMIRLSKNWQLIGFQGNDPATDFRGGGILSLINLCNFTREPEYLPIYEISKNENTWFYFAVTGIHITGWLTDLLYSRKLDKYFENDQNYLDIFQGLYNKTFKIFALKWSETKPTSIMNFNTFGVI